ncbi:helix-turn-helix transcriptional regulator [Actinoplanes oblitus]|uniref:helix-turn-helix transcriptional regulator n=1 Tax=Actinoplanes oblitus TaxID=3040509 RepID=UPI002E1A9E9E
MRAGRLVSLLLLLQARGRMTAQALADELEVSVRTVYRDVESLGAAGVPIYADRGPTGGYQLLDGYRTRLTGLTGAEAGTLFLAGMPGPAAELGLGSLLATAELKLRAALPGELAERADLIRDRFHLDAPGWFRADEPVPHLATVAGAVWDGRRLRIRYRRWKQPREVDRELNPLGVVLKAGRWYLVGEWNDRVTTYRVTNVLESAVLDEPATRPPGFDLAGFWREWTERYERSVYTAEATVRVSPDALRTMPFVFAPEMSRVAHTAAGPPGPDGWRTTVVPIESLRHGHLELLKFGAEVEVLGPPELRARFAASARDLAALYQVSSGSGAVDSSADGEVDGSGSPSVGSSAGGTVVDSADGLLGTAGDEVTTGDGDADRRAGGDGEGEGLSGGRGAACLTGVPAAGGTVRSMIGSAVSDASPAP